MINLKKYYLFNKKIDVIVYCFENVYDETLKSVNYIKDSTGLSLSLFKIPSVLPSMLEESDLFYNLKYNDYASRFSSGRINYLHMEDFVCNLQRLKEISQYDIIHRIDDDSWFRSPIVTSLGSQLFNSKNSFLASSNVYSNVSQGHLDTRINLFDFTLDYCKSNNLIPENPQLREAIDTCNHYLFHSLSWSSGNCNVYLNSIFKSSTWLNWIEAVNNSHGCYKYRWGDQEVIGLYLYIYHPNPLLDLGLVKSGVYSNKLPQANYIVG